MALSKKLKVSYPTIMRWRDQKTPIPGPVALALRLLYRYERHTAKEENHEKPKADTSFLD